MEQPAGASGVVNLNEVIATLATNLATEAIKSVGGVAKAASDRLKLKISSAFKKYMNEQLARRGYVKTILYRQEPQPLYDFYVPQDLSCGDSEIADVKADQLLNESLHTVLTGTGGCGKSFLLRHLFIDTIKAARFVPIFVELKAVNPGENTLETVLFSEIDLVGTGISANVLIDELRRGRFAILLDGLDEVAIEKREAVISSIRQMAKECPAAPILVTSRPDDRFVGWEGFRQYSVEPLTKEKAIRLVERLRYDRSSKSRFLSDLKTSLWSSHQSFLSNPLLLTIMLLTHEHNASVPRKMHLFYSQVFETMWNRHDALKDGYSRVLESGLEKDGFGRVLEAFSFRTYWESKVSLTGAEIGESLQFARQLTQVSFDTEKYLRDLVKAVCVLNQDGLLYTFSHRSFQEYYAARFMIHVERDRRNQLWRSIVRKSGTDQVLHLVWEMDPSAVEREVLIPCLEELESAVVNRPPGTSECLAFIQFWCERIILSLGTGSPRVSDVMFVHKLSAKLLNFMIAKYVRSEWNELKSVLQRNDAEEELSAWAATKGETKLVELMSSEIDESLAGILSRYKIVASADALKVFLNLLTKLRGEHAQMAKTLDDLFLS